MTAADIIVLAIVGCALVAAVVFSIRKRKQNGGCGCGCGCCSENCPSRKKDKNKK